MPTLLLFSILVALSTGDCQEIPSSLLISANNDYEISPIIYEKDAVTGSTQGCDITPNISDYSPLLISPNHQNFLYPKIGNTTVKFEVGEKVTFGCATGQLVINNSLLNSTTAEATCISANQFSIKGVGQTWTNIRCTHLAKAVGNFTGKSCPGGKEAVIGFSFGTEIFIPQITLCFELQHQNTLYTQFDIIAQTGTGPNNLGDPRFEQDTCFYQLGSQTVNDFYNINTQQETIKTLVGTKEYINKNKDFFLSRGHLAARADFFYPQQKNATFKYINVAPQWQSFNKNNWAEAEASIREYAKNHKVNLKVWTGTYGVATLPHYKTKEEIELFLYIKYASKDIKVPALFWKLAFEPITKKGVVILGINNPHESNVTKYIICTDISSHITWMNWHKEDITRGYSYACSVPDFRKAVSYAPELTVNGLLV